MRDFELWLIEQDLAASTVRSYLSRLRHFAAWFEQTNGEALTGPNLTTTDVREYRGHMLTRGAAPATINLALGSLHAYGRWLIASEQASSNPVKGVRQVRVEKNVIRWLDKQAQAKLLRELEKAVQLARTAPARRQAVRNQGVVVFLLNTGLRVNELCALALADITIKDRSGEVRVRAGKGRKWRNVQLNRNARQAVSEWLSVRPASERQQLFLSQRGGPLSCRGVQLMLEEIGKRIAVDVSPHQLRHTFAKNMVNAGVSLEQVSMLIGHDSVSTTAIYITPSWHDLERAVATLEN